MVEEENSKRDGVAGIEKGLRVIEAFADSHPRLSASTAAKRTGLSRTAARRYLLTLRRMGFLESDGTMFWLTPRVLRLGWSYFDSARLPRTVQPFLQQISSELGGVTASFGVLDDGDLVFIARNVSSTFQTLSFMLGARVPANLAAAGIALLSCQGPAEVDAWLARQKFIAYTSMTLTRPDEVRAVIDRARQDGFVILEQQMERDRRGIAVPVQSRTGAVVGAISVSLPISGESSKSALARVLPLLRQAEHSLLSLL